MKIEKRVEAVKVKIKEKATWVKENPKEVLKYVAKGLAIIGPGALACWFGIRNSEKNQLIIDQQQEIKQKDQELFDQQQTISELSDEKELYVESIGILQEEVLEGQRIIKKLASDLLRGRRSLGGSMMNSLKISDSEFDNPQ